MPRPDDRRRIDNGHIGRDSAHAGCHHAGMTTDPSRLPIIDGRETSLPDVCMHPEYGICLTRRMRYEQRPYSWRRVAWRAPALPENPTSITSMNDWGLARLGGVVDHLYTHVSALLHAEGMGRKRLGRVDPRYRDQFHKQMMVGQWTGTMPTPSILAKYGPTCRFRLQDRIGRWAMYLDTISGRKVIMTIDILPDAEPTRVVDPMRIMNRIMEMFASACTAPRMVASEMRERDEAVGHRISCSVLSRGDHWPIYGIAGTLTRAGQGLSDDMMVAPTMDYKTHIKAVLSPELQKTLRSMLDIDMQFRATGDEDFYWASLGMPYWLEFKSDGMKPSAMEILRHARNDDGSPQVLFELDSERPSHPTTEWLVPLRDAALIGDAPMRRLAAELGAAL
jgi:hypothetical protein